MKGDFCSHPGCGYPDGKPCHGCGVVVPMTTAAHFENRTKALNTRIRAIEDLESVTYKILQEHDSLKHELHRVKRLWEALPLIGPP